MKVIRFASLLATVFAFLVSPAYAVGTAADKMCTPWIARCPCDTVPDGEGGCMGGKNTHGCPPGVCRDNTNKLGTQGICIAALKCKAVSFSDANTGAGGGADSALKALGQILGQLLQKMQSSSGGGGSGASTGGSGSSACTTYTSVSTPSNDPCTYYVPNTTSLGTTTDLSNLLNSITSSLNNNQSQPTTSTITNFVDNALGATSSNAVITPGNIIIIGKPYNPTFAATSSLTGNVEVTTVGATLFGVRQDVGNNYIVSGFYGSDTNNGQPQNVLPRLCMSRPWTGSYFGTFIPDTFFDGLCLWQGYSAGNVSSLGANGVIQAQPIIGGGNVSIRRHIATPVATSTQVSNVPAKVHIWAVPATVSIGKRTSIFWSTQGVSNCLETSPDGSFTQNTLSGGASTVPLTTDTTFSISCTGGDGSPVTDYVTVHIGI